MANAETTEIQGARESVGADAVAPSPKPPKKRKKIRPIEVILIAIIVVCIAIIAVIGLQYFLQSQSYDNLAEEVVHVDGDGGDLARMNIDWDTLKAESPDVVGWIIAPDTPINYPIVQGPDNEYYLHRSYDGTSSWASTGGTIFLDASNKADFSDSNNVLYGHHMNDGSMFAAIAAWSNQEDFDAHRTIYVLTPTMNYRLETFAVVLTVGSDAIVETNFKTSDDFAAYVQDKLNRSIIETPDITVKASTLSKMFMLVTCEYSQNDGRICVCALVSEQAVPLK